MLSIKQGEIAIKFVRTILSSTVKNEGVPKDNLPSIFDDNYGVFTTLHTYPSHQLRGCIGIPEPVMSLKKALVESAQSVSHDPRFPVLQDHELEGIIVEVTVLTKPERINEKKPANILEEIKVGRDGLIIEQGYFKGLLLPQVPIEQNWDKKTFVEHTCLKAGLSVDAWKEEKTTIKKFTGQIFTEEKPFGSVQEKTFDES
ncbi:MAG: TIGR00296 family protein [Candidatus Thermoplasmatota archaeon]|nr:TIGR00296 family protein [Candidatus Thermoplasmatota archaeon]MBS3801361.1 TIGR00296 family protein [Candidatus Thermoplasmatota archaeon]